MLYLYIYGYEGSDGCDVSGEQSVQSMVEVWVLSNSCEWKYTESWYRGIIGQLGELSVWWVYRNKYDSGVSKILW